MEGVAYTMESLPMYPRIRDPDQIKAHVQEVYQITGRHLNNVQEPAVLVDALCMDCPIVGATPGCCELTRYTLEQMLGRNCRMLLEGVPNCAISQSNRKNIQDFCKMCRVSCLTQIAHVTSVQPNSRADGTHFMNFFLLGLCMIMRHPFILGVQLHIAEGLCARLTQEATVQAFESTRAAFLKVQEHLRSCSAQMCPCSCSSIAHDSHSPTFLKQMHVAQPEFAFFFQRLQDHCLLIHGGFTAIRREPSQLAFQCMVFGDQPVRPTKRGLCFTLRVNEVTSTFQGLPVLGFTKRQPKDAIDLYPPTNRCLGSSVLIGACGEAFARDKVEHFQMGFKKPPQSEIQTWTLQLDLPQHKRKAPVILQSGDMIKCVYTWDGHLLFIRNEEEVLKFNTERPIAGGCHYYAVVDVCFSTYSLTLVPSDEEPLEQDSVADDAQGIACDDHEVFARETSFSCAADASPLKKANSNDELELPHGKSIPEFDAFLSKLVDEVLVKKCIKTVIAQCNFMVTIADPRGVDCPLVAVSEEFENVTGFQRSEIIGVNCRFLNQGCDMEPEDLTKLRIASQTGAPFTAVIPNRKKNGELFLNLLDLHGLTVAQNDQTGEDLWFLVGVQADVTHLAEEEIPADHIKELQVVSNAIRTGIAKELIGLAMAGAKEVGGDLPTGAAWRLLGEPCWRSGEIQLPESSFAVAPTLANGHHAAPALDKAVIASSQFSMKLNLGYHQICQIGILVLGALVIGTSIKFHPRHLRS